VTVKGPSLRLVWIPLVVAILVLAVSTEFAHGLLSAVKSELRGLLMVGWVMGWTLFAADSPLFMILGLLVGAISVGLLALLFVVGKTAVSHYVRKPKSS
jgi:F0F1-type ATP synthase assembly protein I